MLINESELTWYFVTRRFIILFNSEQTIFV